MERFTCLKRGMAYRYYATRRAYQLAHPEVHRASNSSWKKRNKDKVNAQRRRHYLRHKEEEKLKAAAYARSNPDIYVIASARRRTRITEAGGSFTLQEWRDLCKKHGNRCLRCNKRRKLTPDHVVPVSKGGTSDISNIQPLCKPCNSAKKTKSTDYRKEA